ncbi:MAG: biotin synthase BioB [Deltaproteobacteria bacterium]|nr:biotin synthase BioB [Deltaproteobacteria bacterium]
MTSLSHLAEKILGGYFVSRDEALGLATDEAISPWVLFEQANRLREAHFGNRVHLCSIVNAKMGGCPEDCGFCSQSARFETGVERGTGIISEAEVAKAEARAEAWGSGALSMVTATRGYKAGAEFDKVLARVKQVSAGGRLEAHASLGLLGLDEFKALRAAGCTEFNHNLETGRGYFEKVCTTHTYDDRIATIRNARAVGMRTCVGGIIGMGEAAEDRVDLAMTLRELDVDEVPLNFLVSVEGTPMAAVAKERAPMAPLEMLRQVAMFRFVLPTKNIFICAGRQHLGDLQALIFQAGASGIMIGDFLTTKNRSPEDDLKMISDLGLEPKACGRSSIAKVVDRETDSGRVSLAVIAN